MASAALKAIFAMESRESALAKAESVAAEMEARRLKAAANCLREGVGETTTYLLPEFPDGHRRRIRTNNMIERLNREIRRRTRVVGSFPDGNSALMLVCARIRYVTDNEWSTRRYLDMSRLDDTYRQRTDHRAMDGHDPKCATFRALPTRREKLRKKSKTNLPAFDAINAAALQQQAD